MTENIKEILSEKTQSAKERLVKEEADRNKAAKKAMKAATRKLEVRKEEFVDENLELAIDELEIEMHRKADNGEKKAEKTWRIPLEDESSPEPTEELSEHRALRDKVAEHFTGLGLVAREIDHGDGYDDPHIDPDDGSRKWILTDHIVGLEVSWDAQEQ